MDAGAVLQYFPILEYLEFIEPNPDDKIQTSLEQKVKNGLKRLSILEVERENLKVRVRLGTDWMGYK
jgi:hypothetical protein